MTTKRQKAINRLQNFRDLVVAHLNKIATNPEHSSAHHWKTEIRGWLAQMKGALKYAGKKTKNEWEKRIDELKKSLEDG